MFFGQQPELFAKSIPPSLVNRNNRARPRRTAEIDNAFPMEALPSPFVIPTGA
jgi:hypothetical protein